jgi:proteasome lid subunit RPN8/RPN11
MARARLPVGSRAQTGHYRDAVLRIARSAHLAMIRHAVAGLPNEACGLLGGRYGADHIEVFVPTRNADESAKTYSIGPDGFLAADRTLDPLGFDVVGVMHSHTHTDPYPSPTDVAQADNPMLLGWHYVIVSLRDDEPMLRSWVLDGATIVETPVAIVEG